MFTDLALCRCQTDLGENLRRMAVTVPWRAKFVWIGSTSPLLDNPFKGLWIIFFRNVSGSFRPRVYARLCTSHACVVPPGLLVVQAV